MVQGMSPMPTAVYAAAAQSQYVTIEYSRLATKAERDEVLLAAFRPTVPAEVLQRYVLHCRKLAAVCALDIPPPLFAWSEDSSFPAVILAIVAKISA